MSAHTDRCTTSAPPPLPEHFERIVDDLLYSTKKATPIYVERYSGNTFVGVYVTGKGRFFRCQPNAGPAIRPMTKGEAKLYVIQNAPTFQAKDILKKFFDTEVQDA